MLPQIPDECFNVVTYGHEQHTGRPCNASFDDQAHALEARGFQVQRLPMMPPTFLQQSPTDPTGWVGHFDSPANSLLLNIGDQRRVLLPTVNLDGFSPEYQALSSKFQHQWADFFTARGWEPHLLDATAASRANGLFRCLSYPIPQI